MPRILIFSCLDPYLLNDIEILDFVVRISLTISGLKYLCKSCTQVAINDGDDGSTRKALRLAILNTRSSRFEHAFLCKISLSITYLRNAFLNSCILNSITFS